MNAYLIFDNQKIPIEAINNRLKGDKRHDYNSVLYTPRFGDSTHTRSRVYEAVLAKGQLPLAPNYQSNVILRSAGKKNDQNIPPNGFVFSVRRRTYDDILSQIPEGQQGKIEIRLEPDEWNDVVQAIGGSYALVKGGITNRKSKIENRKLTEAF